MSAVAGSHGSGVPKPRWVRLEKLINFRSQSWDAPAVNPGTGIWYRSPHELARVSQVPLPTPSMLTAAVATRKVSSDEAPTRPRTKNDTPRQGERSYMNAPLWKTNPIPA